MYTLSLFKNMMCICQIVRVILLYIARSSFVLHYYTIPSMFVFLYAILQYACQYDICQWLLTWILSFRMLMITLPYWILHFFQQFVRAFWGLLFFMLFTCLFVYCTPLWNIASTSVLLGLHKWKPNLVCGCSTLLCFTLSCCYYILYSYHLHIVNQSRQSSYLLDFFTLHVLYMSCIL